MTQHALVLGPGQSVSSYLIHAPITAGPSDTALQPASSLQPQEPEPSYLAPRPSIIQQ